jgi:hypothetical protein
MQAAFGAKEASIGFTWAKQWLTVKQHDAVQWFDVDYEVTWTPEQFLAQLEARGLA